MPAGAHARKEDLLGLGVATVGEETRNDYGRPRLADGCGGGTSARARSFAAQDIRQRGHSHPRVSLGCLESRRHALSRWLSVGLPGPWGQGLGT